MSVSRCNHKFWSFTHGDHSLFPSLSVRPTHTHSISLIPMLRSLIEGCKQSVVGVTMVKGDCGLGMATMPCMWRGLGYARKAGYIATRSHIPTSTSMYGLSLSFSPCLFSSWREPLRHLFIVSAITSFGNTRQTTYWKQAVT